MYGKHFQAMYTGSMVGSGSAAFAVWGYVIASMKPDAKVGAQVELNPTLLATMIGEKESVIERAIQKLCAPDPKSRSTEEGGRRLVKLGPYDYRVVNGAKYMAIKNEEERREGNRARQARFRLKNKRGPLNGEEKTLQRLADGEISQEQADDIAAKTREG